MAAEWLRNLEAINRILTALLKLILCLCDKTSHRVINEFDHKGSFMITLTISLVSSWGLEKLLSGDGRIVLFLTLLPTHAKKFSGPLCRYFHKVWSAVLIESFQKERILYRKFSNTGGPHNTRNQLLVFLKKIQLSRFMIIEVHNS